MVGPSEEYRERLLAIQSYRYSSQNFDKKIDVSFSSTFFVQRWEFKKHHKSVYKKDRAEKFLQKVRPIIQNLFFLEICFLTFLGVSR